MSFELILDVVIGLVLVYALFSLLTTLIVEFINARLNRRGRMLEYALYQVLDNATPDRRFFSNLFGGRASPFTNLNRPKSLLTDRFLQLQTIHALMDKDRLPSAVTAEAFSRGVITLAHEDFGVTGEVKDYAALARTSSSRLAQLIVELFPNQVVTREAFDKRLQLYYEDVIHRVQGWFKRETQTWLLAVGFVIAAVFNVNSFDLAAEIASDANLRERLVAVAQSEEKMTALAAEAQKAENIEIIRSRGETELTQASSAGELAEMAREKNAAIDKILGEIEGLKLPIGKCRGDFGVIKTAGGGGTVRPAPKAPTPKQYDAIARAATTEQCATFTTPGYFGRLVVFEMFGWLITAFALSLGAPFWFDMLSKLVAIKSAGGFRKAEKENGEPKQPKQSGVTGVAPDGKKTLKDILPKEAVIGATSPITLSAWEKANLSIDDIKDVQRLLGVPLPLRNGVLDDVATREAIIKYQRDQPGAFTPDGRLSKKLMLELFE